MLFKEVKNHIFSYWFSVIIFFTTFTGNIEPLTFLLLLIVFHYEENQYIPPIILAFICFKLSFFITIPYFLYRAKKKVIFMFIFTLLFCLLNIHFILNISELFDYISYGSEYLPFILYFGRPWAVFFFYQAIVKLEKIVTVIK